jgi:hypothetical protein
MRKFLAGLFGVLLPLPVWAAAQDAKVPANTQEIKISVTPATAAAPPVSITLGARHGHVTPSNSGCTHTGGGNIDVQQPSPDTLIVTMTGIAVAVGSPAKDAVASMDFDLCQTFDVSFDDPKVKKAKVTVEGRVIGLLRGGGKCTKKGCCGGGSASQAEGCATLSCGPASIITVCAPPHDVAGCDSLSVNCHEGPVSGPISAGTYNLHATFGISASHPKSILPCKAASAEFAPDPALDPLWISYWEPFHGAAKKDFGYQLTIKVADDSASAEPEKKPEPEKVPAPEKKTDPKPLSLR